MEILRAYKEFKENGHCIITLDSEGYEHEIIITELGVHTATYRNSIYYCDLTEKFNTNIKKITLLKDLVQDILDNVDEWVEWLCLTDPNAECYDRVITEYKNTILRYAENL